VKLVLPVLISIAVAGCASAPAPPPRPQTPAERPASAFPVRPVLEKKGLEAVMGKDIATLKRLFGEPRIDMVEVYGRKMQFSGKACVLDAFLYPDGKGGTEIVTHIDARRSDGAEVDRAACVEALSRR
jgi:hypothetical protein